MLSAMTDFSQLVATASKADLTASRKLAARTGVTEEQALRARLEQRAARQARHDGPATPWRAWFDGSAHPNPGRCGIGALLTGPNGERVEISQAAGYGNSSEAEYRALIALLEAALRAQARGLTVYGDSRVVVDDVNGPDRTAARSLEVYRRQARALMEQLGGPALRWLPRHKNQSADALSQRAVAAMPAVSLTSPPDPAEPPQRQDA